MAVLRQRQHVVASEKIQKPEPRAVKWERDRCRGRRAVCAQTDGAQRVKGNRTRHEAEQGRGKSSKAERGSAGNDAAKERGTRAGGDGEHREN